MKANEFIKEQGLEKAKSILNCKPKYAQRYLFGMYFKQGVCTWWWSGEVNKWLQYEKHIYSGSKFEHAVDLKDLKTAVEAHEIINSYGGLDAAIANINNRKELGLYVNYDLNLAVKVVQS